jgi:hypothetical protein
VGREETRELIQINTVGGDGGRALVGALQHAQEGGNHLVDGGLDSVGHHQLPVSSSTAEGDRQVSL